MKEHRFEKGLGVGFLAGVLAVVITVIIPFVLACLIYGGS